MKSLPGIGRRSVLRAMTASAVMAGTALALPATGIAAAPAGSAAAVTVAATPPPTGHRHLIGVL
ncbi:hypothetical protein BJH93_12470 [Kocuria polaris]|nr:hypothetical protein [Kocuria polaris]